MRKIQSSKDYAVIQVSPAEARMLFFGMDSQIKLTLEARRKTDPQSPAFEKLGEQLKNELLLKEDLHELCIGMT